MALGKIIAAPLLLLTLILYIIVVSFAGWALNRYINSSQGLATNLPAGNNAATPYFVLLSLIAGVVGIASCLSGLHHLKSWRGESGASAASSALIAWLLTLLALGLAAKEIRLGHRGNRLKTLEAFIILAAFFQLLYLLILHAGLHSSKYGPGYGNNGYGAGPHQKGTAAPAV